MVEQGRIPDCARQEVQRDTSPLNLEEEISKGRVIKRRISTSVVRLRLRSMGLIDEKDQKIEVSPKPKTLKKKPKTKYRKFTQRQEDELRLLFTETKGEIKQISEEMNRTKKSIRMKLWFLDLIGEDDVTWMNKIHKKDY